MRRKSLEEEDCPIARALDLIGDWWSLLIVRDALFGKRRFGEFQQSLGLARNILAARLRKLVACGILETEPASDGSAYRDYLLTERGQDLLTLIVALRQWGEGCFARGELKSALVDSKSGKPVRPVELRARDGRLLGPGDIRYVEAPAVRISTSRAHK